MALFVPTAKLRSVDQSRLKKKFDLKKRRMEVYSGEFNGKGDDDLSKFMLDDLQLAAELGKTLLERNKELEILLKEHKSTIEEQEQEILYLKKHTTALREVNDSRLKVYEQLEVGIQDLERANHRLSLENSNDKKHLKTLTNNIETLEARCDELTKQLEETRQAFSAEKRKNERLIEEKSTTSNEAKRLKPIDLKDTCCSEILKKEGFTANTVAPENCSFAFQSPDKNSGNNSTGISSSLQSEASFDISGEASDGDNAEIIKIVNDLETTKKAFLAEQQRCVELEDQLLAIIQENQLLQGRIVQPSGFEETRSMQEELSILDEVRQGQMCSRCMRAMEDRATINDDQSSIAPTEKWEDEEDRGVLQIENIPNESVLEESSELPFKSSVSIKILPHIPDTLSLKTPSSPNPYRDLVEKYEALLEVQRSSLIRKGVSLAEEFQSSSVDVMPMEKMIGSVESNITSADNCNASSHDDGVSSYNGSISNNDAASSEKIRKQQNCGRTPTEFSEAETFSSGFSDESSCSKCTQTEDKRGYFLCSIGDGEDCKFSIYDDASPIDSRFRNRPEYRELFKEIFAVLKKAAEHKEEGEKLPLLDDTHPTCVGGGSIAKVPPVTPANEELPADFGEDSQSIISSAVSEQSFAMSECVTKLERKTAKKHMIEKNQENKPPACGTKVSELASPYTKKIVENGRVLTPLKREPLEYLSVGAGIKKKNRKKNRNLNSDRSESPVSLPSPPRYFLSSGKKRKDSRPLQPSPMSLIPEQSSSVRNSRIGAKFEWNGSSMVIYNRNGASPHYSKIRGRELDINDIEYRPSTVSQDLHKLKKLDLSYAEVLRRADACKQQQHQHPQQHHQQKRKHH